MGENWAQPVLGVRVPGLVRRALALAFCLALFPSAAHAAGVRTAEFGMRVPLRAFAGARAASGSVTTAPLRAPHRYDLVGARWRGGSARVWLRGRKAGGAWSRWVQLASSEEAVRGGSGSEPVWAGGMDLVQLRSSRPLRGLRLDFVNARVPAGRAARVRRQVPLPTGGTLSVLPRSAWGANRCRPRKAAGYGHVQLAFVHHTESLNGYRPSDSPSIVLGICLFHRNVNRWDDIGYNFLVDRYGQVFEGRNGGMDEPGIGAQAGGFNVYSTGVAAIGDFRFRRFPAAGMNALARLLAWKLSLNGVPAFGTVTVASGGGVFTPFRKGTPVTLNRISGHRDADSTVCPGNALYAQLPALRSMVAQLEGPVSSMSLAASATRVAVGQSVTFSGQLTPAPGVAVPPGATVEIQTALASGGRTVAVAPLAPDGSFSATLPMTRSDVLQARFAGGGGVTPLVAAPVGVNVAPLVSLAASATAVTRGSTVTLSGSVTPAFRKLSIVEQELRGTRYRRIRTLTVKPSASAFSVAVGLARSGSYRFIARTARTRQLAAGVSAPVAVQVSG
jgi:N-acetylmuramoyl-L-alanine amidase-like protein